MDIIIVNILFCAVLTIKAKSQFFKKKEMVIDLLFLRGRVEKAT